MTNQEKINAEKIEKRDTEISLFSLMTQYTGNIKQGIRGDNDYKIGDMQRVQTYIGRMQKESKREWFSTILFFYGFGIAFFIALGLFGFSNYLVFLGSGALLGFGLWGYFDRDNICSVEILEDIVAIENKNSKEKDEYREFFKTLVNEAKFKNMFLYIYMCVGLVCGLLSFFFKNGMFLIIPCFLIFMTNPHFQMRKE